MSVLLNARPEERRPLPHLVRFFTAAAPPPAAVLKAMGEAGFDVTHLYGLTETYGPAVVNDWKDEWHALDHETQAHLKARQGVRYHALEALDVLDPETMQPVPADGQTMGEVMFRGNVVMKGYLKNKASTDKAFAGDWFHSGDLGVKHPDGYRGLNERDQVYAAGQDRRHRVHPLQRAASWRLVALRCAAVGGRGRISRPGRGARRRARRQRDRPHRPHALPLRRSSALFRLPRRGERDRLRPARRQAVRAGALFSLPALLSPGAPQPGRGRAEALGAPREQDQAPPRRQCRNSLAVSAETEGDV